ncbi:MAG: hybrid sensor histidine kinase/response regulator [Anaerolineae bacterium]
MSDSELLSIFWVEVREYLDTLNSTLLQVETHTAGTNGEGYHAAVKEMNRVAHSLKGAARAVGVRPIELVAHQMEEIFSATMSRHLELTPEICDTLYDGLDLIQAVTDGESPSDETLNAVQSALRGWLAPPPPSHADPLTDSQEIKAVPLDMPPMPVSLPAAPPAPVPEPAHSPTAKITTQAESSTILLRPVEETIRVTVSKMDTLMAEVSELFIAHMHAEAQQDSIKGLRQTLARWQREWRAVRTAYIRLARQGEQISPEIMTIFRFLETNQRYLTEVNRALAQLAQTAAQDAMRLGTLADQLQDDVGSIRLVPFESVASGLQRMVRDLARDLGKQVTVEVIGAQVELDKAVLDELKDPLLHVLRNAVDHGIETPHLRQQHGKSPAGLVEMEVQQRGSEIVIEVRDDGSGIAADRVRRAIVRNGLLSETDAAALSDDEARTYIFYSGLSTSDEVTPLSGRGMGMDIVRDRVESLRGRVSVQSVVGKGTTITLAVPISLTRIRCVLLRLGQQTFALPSAMVIRMDKVPRDAVFTAEGRDMLQVAGRSLPVVSLGAVLDVPTQDDDPGRLCFIGVEATDRAVAFEVDDVFSEQELVLKPLGVELARARFVSGAALLGTGDVIIVLDANDLIRQATGTALPARRRTSAAAPAPTQRRLRVLVVDDSITTRTLEKNILETAGFEVHVAINGREAWEMLAQTSFDVVISDVEMPYMTGLELTTLIKNTDQFRYLPVILLTSLGKPEQREAGLRAGADTYLIKSQFDQGELLQAIYSVV